jgi:hypothetical protein
MSLFLVHGKHIIYYLHKTKSQKVFYIFISTHLHVNMRQKKVIVCFHLPSEYICSLYL